MPRLKVWLHDSSRAGPVAHHPTRAPADFFVTIALCGGPASRHPHGTVIQPDFPDAGRIAVPGWVARNGAPRVGVRGFKREQPRGGEGQAPARNHNETSGPKQVEFDLIRGRAVVDRMGGAWLV